MSVVGAARLLLPHRTRTACIWGLRRLGTKSSQTCMGVFLSSGFLVCCRFLVWRCVQVRLACSAGDSPVGVEVRARQDLPRGDHESPGCIKRERIVASKKVAPRAEPTSEGRRQHEQPNTDRYGCSPRRGGSDGTVTRTCRATGEALLVPARNRRSKVARITGDTGKSAEDERVAAGSGVARKRSNVRGAKGPAICNVSNVRKARTR